MSEYAGGISAASSLVGSGTSAYGAYLSGRQAESAYGMQSALAMRSKEEARYNIGLQTREANLMRDQADDLLQEAEWMRQYGRVKERKFQQETDRGVSATYARMAQSGVAMAYGSPMEVIDEIATERAKDYDVLKWGNESEYYMKHREATRAREKATIMLDRASMDMANLPMFDYQSALYDVAGYNAKTASYLNMGSALMGGAQGVFAAGAKYYGRGKKEE